MLKRNWVIVALGMAIAFSGLFFVFSFLAVSNYQKENALQRDEIAQNRAQIASEYLEVCIANTVGISALSECIVNSANTNREAQTAKYDLIAQQQMAEWSLALLLVSFFGVVISSGGLVALFVSLSQTRTAISDTRRIGQAQVTAYLSVTNGHFIVRHDGGIELIIELHNFGQSPAKQCTVLAQLLSPKLRENRVEPGWDFSAPIGAEVFSIVTNVPAIATIVFERPFQTEIGAWHHTNENGLAAEVQLRWIDVFHAKKGPVEFSLHEQVKGFPVYNNDSPKSRTGDLTSRAKQPSDKD